MRYLSVCSGIEAATVAWHPFGWRAAAFSEIEKFPRAVLAHHYPDTPIHGDFTTIGADDYGAIDLLVGGTPCQSFSIAGLRGGLADERGNLALEYLRLADRKRPRWLVWENVPGVLSSNGGRDFGTFLGGMGELGYGFAYAILDAQHFGVPQRRRRVFVVGYLGDWRRAAAVLFERHSLSGDTPPRREAGQAAPTIPSRSSAGGGLGTDFDCDGGLITGTDAAAELEMLGLRPGVARQVGGGAAGRRRDGPAGMRPMRQRDGQYLDRIDSTGDVAHSLRAEGFDASEDGTGRETPLVAVERIADTLTSNGDAHSGYRDEKGLVAVHAIQERAVSENPEAGPDGKGWRNDGTAYTLEARQTVQAVAFNDIAGTLKSCGGKSGTPNGAEEADRLVGQASAVRRLTPRECERLQGFPDDYTLIPWRGKAAADCPDGPRYKALGNSMAVPVMRWIGERIQQVDALALREAA